MSLSMCVMHETLFAISERFFLQFFCIFTEFFSELDKVLLNFN
jgi:hypothetical protein